MLTKYKSVLGQRRILLWIKGVGVMNVGGEMRNVGKRRRMFLRFGLDFCNLVFPMYSIH
jgi:hypothetical protein